MTIVVLLVLQLSGDTEVAKALWPAMGATQGCHFVLSFGTVTAQRRGEGSLLLTHCGVDTSCHGFTSFLYIYAKYFLIYGKVSS